MHIYLGKCTWEFCSAFLAENILSHSVHVWDVKVMQMMAFVRGMFTHVFFRVYGRQWRRTFFPELTYATALSQQHPYIWLFVRNFLTNMLFDLSTRWLAS